MTLTPTRITGIERVECVDTRQSVVLKVRNFIGKLQLEEKRKDERLSEASRAQDSLASAAAKEAVMMRYEQAQKKIQVGSSRIVSVLLTNFLQNSL